MNVNKFKTNKRAKIADEANANIFAILNETLQR